MKTQTNKAIHVSLKFAAFGLLLAAAQPYAHASNWITTGPLSVGREWHTATVLPDGQVLVAGGWGNGGALADVETYDAVSGTWTTNTPLNMARRLHTATLLPDGNVLVVGGNGGGGSLTDVESFDPAGGTWTTVAPLTAAREQHTATLLKNGEVLVVGGEYRAGPTSSELTTCVLYDPASGTWTNAAPLHFARYAHTATLLPDGKVLVAGGYGKISLITSGALNSAELYDPATDTWATNTSLNLNVARYGHTATLLRDGKVLVVGGEDSSGNSLASAELYDPASETWTATGPLNDARRGHAAVLLPNGHVLVVGGYDGSSVLASTEDYDPNSGTWTLESPLNTARESHTATLLPNGSVLAAGGYNAGYLAGAEVLPQPVFSDIEAGLPGAYLSSVAWGDYDNDGHLDFLLTGTGTNGALYYPLWHNTGSGFTNVVSLLATYYANEWGDFNNDGKLDILDDGGGIWLNTGSDFTNLSTALPQTQYGSVAWGDYDGDGRADVLILGFVSVPMYDSIYGEYYVLEVNTNVLWHNTSDGFVPVKSGLPQIYNSAVAWGDYDGDGRLDLLVSGTTNGNNPITQVWRNTGHGFTNINAGLPGVVHGSVAWGDYDGDGRLDILMTGATTINYGSDPFKEIRLDPFGLSGNPGGFITEVWRNTGNGFTNIHAGLPGVWCGSAAWGDYDNDGRLDILLTGATNSFVVVTANNDVLGTTNYQEFASGFLSQVWRNTGTGFTNINAGLPGVGYSSAVWGDYDNDGRLDILLSGATGEGSTGAVTTAVSQIWRNNAARANTPPVVPGNLTAALSGNFITFSWSAAGDSQTPSNGLSYNLRVGSSPGSGDLVSPLSASTGSRNVPRPGNAQERLYRTISGLPPGQPIYWSVQAVDGAFAGSAFAPEQTLTFNTVFTPPNGVPVPGDVNGDGIVDQSELAAVLAYLNGNGMVNQSELNLVLSNYWPYSPWLSMTNVAGLGGTNVTFALSNSVAGDFSVEYTTNLVDWYYLGPATPRYLFIDTNAPAVPQRFYRLRWP